MSNFIEEPLKQRKLIEELRIFVFILMRLFFLDINLNLLFLACINR